MTRTLILLAVTLGSLSAADPPPDAREIVRKSVEVLQTDWTQAPNYSYTERAVHSKKRSQPIAMTFRVSMINGVPYRHLLAIDDQPLSSRQQTVEERKLVSETEKIQGESDSERADRVYSKQRDRDHAILMEIADAFDFTLAGEESVGGHDCWVLDAKPRPDYTPKNAAAKVLTAMHVRLWIDKNQSQWVKVEAEVFQPVSFYGVIAKVSPGTRLTLEQQPISDGVWLPKHFSMRVNATALGFINENSSDDKTYSNYAPQPEITARLVTKR